MFLNQCEAALKDFYLPAFKNQLAIEPASFLQKVKKVPLAANNIVSVAPIGLNGGFGFCSEGRGTPAAGENSYMEFKEKAKDMYCNIEVSDKTMKLGNNNKAAMLNILDSEVQSSYETAKWNLGRSLFGNGKGILCNVSALATAGNVIQVDSVKYLKEGLTVDIYEAGAPVGSAPAVGCRRIKAINRVASAGKYAVTIGGAATTLEAGFITVQNSYGNEITGFNAIFDDGITSLYGISKASNPIIKPVVVSAGSDISDSIITSALRESQKVKGGKIDMIFAGNTAYDAYSEYLRSNNQRIENNLKLEGGFTGIDFTYGNTKAIVINEEFVPDNEMWGIDTSAFELHHMDWSFVQKDNGVFTLVPNTSYFRALLANYGNLICKNPGSCVRITDIA